MAIISAGYPRVSPDRPASIDAIQWARMAAHLGAEYWVGGTTDWAVRPVSGADRTVTVGTGTGGGHGVHDEVTEPEPVQFEPLNSGTRWDTIVARRDWANAETTFVALRGGTSRAIATGRATEPGSVDEQPVALCQLQSVTGGARIGTIAHLSPRVSPGGMVVHHPESLSFLNKPGSKVYVVSEGTEYHRVLNSNGVPRWEEVLREEHGRVSPRLANWTRDLLWWRHGSLVTIEIRANLTSGSVDGWAQPYTLPNRARPRYEQIFDYTSRRVNNQRGLFHGEIQQSGWVRIYNSDPNWGLPAGTAYHARLSYEAAS